MIGFFTIFLKIKKEKLISITLALSSGIIFGISIFDLFFESIKLLNNYFLFFLIFLLSFFIVFFINKGIKNDNELYKTGLVTMIGLILHNIPEGILTFASFNISTKLGISMTIAIVLHNIPEGISIAIPIYYSTNNKIKAFLYTLISSFAEPFGAIITILFLKELINNIFLGITFSAVSGIMIYISIFELLKESYSYNYNKQMLYYLIGILFVLINNIIW